MIEKIKMETRRYAKRQITWFKRNKNIIWLNAEESADKNLEIILNTSLLQGGKVNCQKQKKIE